MIDATWTVREVVSRHPGTGAIFLQHGRAFRASRGQLYANYDPPLTVGDYAALNGIEIGPLLGLLNAAAEAEDFPAKASASGGGPGPHEHAESGGRGETGVDGTFGYTGGVRQAGETDSVLYRADKSYGPGE